VNVSIARRGRTPNRASSTGPAMCPAGPRAMTTAAAKASFYAIVARTAIWLVHQFIHNKSYLTPHACTHVLQRNQIMKISLCHYKET
jgi:hypothetical protein